MATSPADPGAPDDLMGLWRERIAADRRAALENESLGLPPHLIPVGLERAAAHANVGMTLPTFDNLRPPRRLAARLVARLMLYVLHLISDEQRIFNGLLVRVLRALYGEMLAVRADLAPKIDAHDAQLTSVARRLCSYEGRLSNLEGALAPRDRRLSALEDASAEGARRLSVLEEALAERDRWIAALDAELREARTAFAESHAAQRAPTLEAAHRGPTGSGGQSASDARAPGAVMSEPWLIADAFRGSEEDVRERQRPYLTHFEGRRAVVDIGCGRGEFLELLRDAGIPARGVDADRDMSRRCREKGLDVACADLFSYLGAQPDASLGGIFCAQVVEHFGTPDLFEFVRLAHRTLEPGAPLLIETLNPESLFVLYRWFWLDPTHQRLVHPRLLEVVLHSRGFHDVAITYSPPPEGPLRIPAFGNGAGAGEPRQFDEATRYLNDLLYGSFDYALIAVR